ncbi:glutamate racemase [Neolewinella antarctica]|uniref:Glutamate racemase n=1 Tax=Neolewinella antarctica TaxID=442734 RepID=A0ABX0XEW8_9BACT|nr:glutamate racemase [Neolewinella antarctica]NJC27287.1 glutamate racemase [Neolewinella antarctica]
MDAHAPIGVFDSGIGGLSVAAAVAELLPREDILYVSDNQRAPYGPREAAEILAYSEEITRFLLKCGAKMIVVACNTATSVAIDRLREEFPEVPFVGLEPAVKPAANGNVVGVLATEATLNSERYLALRDKHLSKKVVLENPCRGLVSIIEAEQPGSNALRDKLRVIITPMISLGLDTLVLGCTHYPMIKEDIQFIAGPDVRIIDPSPAAAKQVAHVLSAMRGGVDSPDSPQNPGTRDAPITPVLSRGNLAHDFICTGNSVALQRALLRLSSLNRRRRWVLPFGKIN